jgi:hypothetical protein
MGACVDQMMAAPLNVAGWEPVSIACTPSDAKTLRLSVAFRRAGGTTNWIAPSLTSSQFKPHISFSAESGTAEVFWTVPLSAETYNKESPTKPTDQIREYLLSQYEEIFEHYTGKVETQPPVMVPDGPGKQKALPPDYRYLEFSFQTSHDPRDFTRILAPLPVFVTSSVKLELGKWNWAIEGKIYEKLQQPRSASGQ